MIGIEGQDSGHTIADAHARLLRLIRRRAVSPQFQPIVDLRDATITGYEALARPHEGTGFHSPAEFFRAAEHFGMVPLLESVCRRRALETAGAVDTSQFIFINVAVEALLDDAFSQMLEEDVAACGLHDRRRIVLEITERASEEHLAEIGPRSLALREAGFQIAIDDVGAGMNGLTQLTLLRPNWLKLDRNIVDHIDYDPLKRNLVRFFVQFARLSDMHLVAEGIERQEELKMLMELGVTHAQGFLLARPDAYGKQLDDDTQNLILTIRDDVEQRRFCSVSSLRIRSLATPVTVVHPSNRLNSLTLKDRPDHDVDGTAVYDGDRMFGWLPGARYRELIRNGSGPSTFAEVHLDHPLLVSEETTLAEAMEALAGRSDAVGSLPLLTITKDGTVAAVTTRDMLRAAASTCPDAPSHITPLTGLPDRAHADHWLTRQLRDRKPHDLAFIDLEGFEGYNISHGFDQGDRLLLRLVSIVQAEVVNQLGDECFFAHLGADRFLLALPANSADVLQTIQARFDQTCDEFFTPMEVACQAYCYTDVDGQEQRRPLTAVRIIYMPYPMQYFGSLRGLYHHVATLREKTSRQIDEHNRLFVIDEPSVARHQRASA